MLAPILPPELSIVLTALNEAECLPFVLEELSPLAAILPVEVIVVDDNSSDNTLEVLKELREKVAMPLRILRHSETCGKSAGLFTGISNAEGHLILTMDADGQDDPSVIPHMLEKAQALLKSDKDPLIIGVRKKRSEAFSKRYASRIANFIRRAILKDKCIDTGSPIKLFPKDLFLTLPRFEGLHRFIPALMQQYGAQMECIDVHQRPRVGGVSKYNNINRLKRGLADTAGVFWLLKRYKAPKHTVVE